MRQNYFTVIIITVTLSGHSSELTSHCRVACNFFPAGCASNLQLLMRVKGNVNRDEYPFVPKKPAASNGRSHFRPAIRGRASQTFVESSVFSRRRGIGGTHATAIETEHFRRRAEFTSLAYS